MLSVSFSHQQVFWESDLSREASRERAAIVRDMSFARKEISERAFGIIFHHPLLQTLEIAKKNM